MVITAIAAGTCFLVLIGMLASGAANEALHATSSSVPRTVVAAAAAGTPSTNSGSRSVARSSESARRAPAAEPGATSPTASGAAASDVTLTTVATEPADPTSHIAQGNVAAPRATASAPGSVSSGATIAPGAPAQVFSPPTIVQATITGCTLNSSGGGTVTYAVSFDGGSAWAPAANYQNGVYTVNVEGGNGANSGLNAVIAGAPIEDTADGVSSYVLFPPSMVLTARC